MQASLMFLKFNNYFNREVNARPTWWAYNSIEWKVGELDHVNFIMNDGIDTEQVVNWNDSRDFDYVIVRDENVELDPRTVSPSNKGYTRWFVINTQELRNGQLKITLHRDLIADNMLNIRNAPVFIYKGKPSEAYEMAIKEDVTYNQIKQSEKLLKDNTESAWIVGYIDRNYDGGTIECPIAVSREINKVYSKSFSGTDLLTKRTLVTKTLDGYRLYYAAKTSDTSYSEAPKFRIFAGFNFNNGNIEYVGPADAEINRLFNPAAITARDTDGEYTVGRMSTESALSGIIAKNNWNVKTIVNYANQYLNTYKTYGNTLAEDMRENMDESYYKATYFDNELPENGWNIKDSTGTVYTVTKEIEVDETEYWGIQDIDSDPFNAHIRALLDGMGYNVTAITDQIFVRPVFVKQYIKLDINKTSAYSVTIPNKANRVHLTDAPYDMFCIPYGPVTVKGLTSQAGAASFVTNKSVSLNVASQLAVGLGGGSDASFIYDLQLLPYCPAQASISANCEVTVSTGNATVIKLPDQVADSVMIWCDKSTFTTTCKGGYSIEGQPYGTMKQVANTQIMRLNSPNWSGSFDFNLAMNGGAVKRFNVDCTYRPYSPYIHVAPVWSGLYGTRSFGNQRDAIGLICSGDFSIPMMSDAWTNYEIQNKNYQNIFDRETQTLDVNHKYDMEVLGWKGALGILTGAAQGLATGARFGSGVGAGVGALVGAGASVGGAYADQYYTQAKYTESMSYRQDQFNYNLGNIQALPNSITKVGALNPNNKLFPFVEVYDCTAEEKAQFNNLVKYKGSTLNKVTTLRQQWYLQSGVPVGGDETEYFMYIQGEFLRLPISELSDYTSAVAINDELKRGVKFMYRTLGNWIN